MPLRRPSPRFALFVFTLAIAGLLALLLVPSGSASPTSAPLAAPAAPLQGGSAGNAPSGDVLLSSVPELDRVPSVAYNTVDHEFLVVWVSDRNIVGQRYDSGGVPNGETFRIGDLAAWSSGPHVAYAASLNRYLVVWDDQVGDAYDVFGRLLEADGSLVNEQLSIADRPGHQREPSITATGSDFFVAWEGNHGDDSIDIVGRAISSSSLMYDPHAIASGGSSTYRRPQVSYEPLSGEHLVVFEYGELPDTELRARRFKVDGPLGEEFAVPEGGISFEADVTTGRFVRDGAWFVVWKSFDGVAEVTAARIVRPGADGVFVGPEFTIDTAGLRAHRARVDWHESARRYIVIWEADDPQGFGTDLVGHLYTEDGTAHGSPFEVVGRSAFRSYADVVAGTEPEQAFVVWEDRSTTDVNVAAQRLDADGSQLWYEMTVSAANGRQDSPAVACDPEDNQCLAVWESTGAVGTSIYGQRLDATGRPMEGAWLIEGVLSHNLRPDVVYNAHARSYLVIWADVGTHVVEGRRVFPGGNTTVKVEVSDSFAGTNPRLIYNVTDGRHLAVWQAHGDVYAHLLDWDGLSIGQESTLVAEGVTAQGEPVVAHDTTRNGYLVVWRDGTTDGQDLYGQLLNAEARLAGEPFLVAGGGNDPMPHYGADVAYDVRTRSFLVTYVAGVGPKEGDIRAQQLAFDGDKMGEAAVVRDKPDGAEQSSPQVTISETTGRYHVVWSERWPLPAGDATGRDLFGRWLLPSGRPVGAVLPVFRYAGEQSWVRTAPGVGEDEFILVWNDKRRSSQGDIYGKLGTLDTQPPTARFRVDPSSSTVGSTFSFDARGSRDDVTPTGALSVRWDWTSDGQYDTSWSLTKTITRSIATAGTYTTTLEVRDAAGQTATTSRQVQVFRRQINSRPMAAVHAEPESGTAGDPFVFDATGSGDNETPDQLEVRWDWEDDGEYDTDWGAQMRLKHTLTRSGANRIRVEVRDEGGLTSSAVVTVQVTPGPTSRLEIAPGTATLLPGDVLRFFAATWDEHGNAASNTNVVWRVTNEDAGVIDATGVFTAGTRVGPYADVVLASDGDGRDAASITIVGRTRPTDTPEPGVTPSTRPTRRASPTPPGGGATATPTRNVGPTVTPVVNGHGTIYLPMLYRP